ncbi:MAG: DNA cytosine methyltransferase [Ruminococcus sp.]|nr:DNA cytosine methyltransferase [Ruminococcus sp.]
MNRQLTLGSLFDGSGTFPVAGILSGIKPVWKSEIEPFPIAVTEKRLPQVKYYGDISYINGAELETVDIITFGSPCTDLSIAGKRAGLNAEHSGLFFQAIRVIKEMRCATNGRYPRFIVWENVCGAFSSNGGEDFRTVLEEICKIKDGTISVPRPEKWAKSGEIVGDNFSVAYRTLDAQYWGVAQRRKRIYLVADFDGECAGKILFESESLSGYSAESFRAWQAASRSAENRFGILGTGLMFENHSQDTRYTGPLEIAPTVLSTYGTGGNNQPFVVEKQTFGICSKNSSAMMSDNPHSGFYKADSARTVDTSGINPSCNQGGIVVLEGNGSRPSHHGNGYRQSDIMYTLNCIENHSVVYSTSKNSHHTEISENLANTLTASDYKDPPTISEEPEYTVRRLTPQECALLQGMPTWWCDELEIPNPTEEQLKFWHEVFETHHRAVNPDKKSKSDKQILKWLKNPYSDSAAYKMWGNGIALPCAWFVLAGIAYYAIHAIFKSKMLFHFNQYYHKKSSLSSVYIIQCFRRYTAKTSVHLAA